MLVHNREICVHATLLNPAGKNYLLRAFAHPPGPLEPETGQPWKPYFATMVLADLNGVAEVQGALTIPKNSLGVLRELSQKLEINTLWWQSWNEIDRIKLPPKRWKI